MNLVEKQMLELANSQPGRKKKLIREVRRKVLIPNKRYSWMLFEHPADTEPVNAVVLDVDLDQAIKIDRRVAEILRNTLHVIESEALVEAE